MNQVIKLLEQIGKDSTLQDQELVIEKINELKLSNPIKSSILEKNIDDLETLLDVRSEMFCGVFPAEDDEPADDEQENEETNAVINI
ncbi:hypothetical protein [Thalassotalea sp. PLHSN55]|uniref:hypothetical protein n=1 Tax=Thalassotalea sp. PLHSN55 TaxID=3435888 RepID=UPI003F828E17